MPKITVYNTQGEKVEELNIREAVFGVPSNNQLLQQVYLALSANLRGAHAHTKTRGERSGSGKKPWKQKGTGRARVGSVRSPVWRKGGVIFGPTKEQNFGQKINAKMRRKAIMVALSEKVRAGKLIVLEKMGYAKKKTKLFAETLTALKLSRKSLVVGLTSEEKEFEWMTRNIPRLNNVALDTLNAKDVLDHQYVLVTRVALEALEKRLDKAVE